MPQWCFKAGEPLFSIKKKKWKEFGLWFFASRESKFWGKGAHAVCSDTLFFTSLDVITQLLYLYLFYSCRKSSCLPSLCRWACSQRDQWHLCIMSHGRRHQRCLQEGLGPADGVCLDTVVLPRKGLLEKGIDKDDEVCWNTKGWMWPVPPLTFWEDKGLAAAHPGMLKPY